MFIITQSPTISSRHLTLDQGIMLGFASWFHSSHDLWQRNIKSKAPHHPLWRSIVHSDREQTCQYCRHMYYMSKVFTNGQRLGMSQICNTCIQRYECIVSERLGWIQHFPRSVKPWPSDARSKTLLGSSIKVRRRLLKKPGFLLCTSRGQC